MPATTNSENSEPDLADRIDAQARATLQYGRRRFLWTWLFVALLAVMTGAALEVAVETAKRQNDNVKLTASNASADAADAQASNDEVVQYLRGEQGIPGVPGSNGKNGSPGLPSSTPGPKGDAGSRGADGPAGATGSTGEPGSEGAPGPAGASGTAGATGEPGTAGAAGEKGTEGSQGETGPRGEVGSAGPRGEAGATGATGATGPQGPAGLAQPLTTTIVTAASPNDVNNPKDVTATCPAGTTLLSGGYHWTPATPGLTALADEPDPANGWHVEVSRDTFPANSLWQLTVFAVCNSVPPTPK